MSTRALRRLQREQEEAKRMRNIDAPTQNNFRDNDGSDEENDETDVEEEVKIVRKEKAPLNAFEMLDQASEEEEDGETIQSDHDKQKSELRQSSEVRDQEFSAAKKKKKRRKAKDKGSIRVGKTDEQSGLRHVEQAQEETDEIDRALRQLSLKMDKAVSRNDDRLGQNRQHQEDFWEMAVSKLLAVDSKHLNPRNEMRSLFGSIALEEGPRHQAAPDDRGRVGLDTALAGRHSPVSRGKELGSLAKRRNVLMQGQENWPLAISGGLGMETVTGEQERSSEAESAPICGRKYRIVHNSAYTQTQHQFKQAVESMSAENMIHLLIYHPYHIAALLQVAEIAKHQGDHSVTGDLLERALFAFGRSVHSTFGVSIREGLARMKFDESPTRELYLTIWRYLQNLEMRGTWRTAFEWSKMLLSFDILSDPYGMTHTLDQYALRGRQHDALIAFCSEEAFGKTWSHLPNMQISLALAYHRAGQPKLARQRLALATHRYPYILSHLCSTLEISPLPKALWGVTPSTDAEKLYTELYVTRAKDLWTTPEAKALLAEVAETLDSYQRYLDDQPPAPKLAVSLEDARFILLLDIPSLIALLPRSLRSLPTAQYDVLPPPSSIDDAGLTALRPGEVSNRSNPVGNFVDELVRLASGRLFGRRAGGGSDRGAGGGSDGIEADNEARDTAANLVNTARGDGAAEVPAPEDLFVQPADVFNTTLADANLHEDDRAAILAALAESGDEAELDEGSSSTNQFSGSAAVHAQQDGSIDGNEDLRRAIYAASPSVAAAATADNVTSSTAVVPNTGATSSSSSPSSALPSSRSPPAQPTTQPTTQQTNQQIQRTLLTTLLDDLLRQEEEDKQQTQQDTASSSYHQEKNENAMQAYVAQLRLLRPREREWVLGMVRQRLRIKNRTETMEDDNDNGDGDGRGGDGDGDLVERIRKAMSDA